MDGGEQTGNPFSGQFLVGVITTHFLDNEANRSGLIAYMRKTGMQLSFPKAKNFNDVVIKQFKHVEMGLVGLPF